MDWLHNTTPDLPITSPTVYIIINSIYIYKRRKLLRLYLIRTSSLVTSPSSYLTILNSVLRLAARPSSVALSATGTRLP